MQGFIQKLFSPSKDKSKTLLNNKTQANQINTAALERLLYNDESDNKMSLLQSVINQNPTLKVAEGFYFLHYLLKGMCIDDFITLVKLGADLTVADELGNTPLHAIFKEPNFSAEMIETIFKHHPNLNVNLINNNSETPLLNAVMCTEASMDFSKILVLVKRKAIINIGETTNPLTIALSLKNIELTSLLLKGSFDKDALERNYSSMSRKIDELIKENKDWEFIRHGIQLQLPVHTISTSEKFIYDNFNYLLTQDDAVNEHWMQIYEKITQITQKIQKNSSLYPWEINKIELPATPLIHHYSNDELVSVQNNDLNPIALNISEEIEPMLDVSESLPSDTPTQNEILNVNRDCELVPSDTVEIDMELSHEEVSDNSNHSHYDLRERKPHHEPEHCVGCETSFSSPSFK